MRHILEKLYTILDFCTTYCILECRFVLADLKKSREKISSCKSQYRTASTLQVYVNV